MRVVGEPEATPRRRSSFLMQSARRRPEERGADAELRELVRVLAVGQTRDVRGTKLTLLSVERYDDGFVAQFWVRREMSDPTWTVAAPDFLPVAIDDRGGRYVAWPHGGSGGGHPSRMTWRYAFRFAPALDAAAAELRLEVPEIGLVRPDPARDLSEEEVVAGPWSFAVPLA